MGLQKLVENLPLDGLAEMPGLADRAMEGSGKLSIGY